VWGFFQLCRERVRGAASGSDSQESKAAVKSKVPATNDTDGLQQELDTREAQIQYLQGMLQQKTMKRHPLRFQNNDKTERTGENKGLERGHEREKERGVGKRRGTRRHTMDDTASVYAASNPPLSPRAPLHRQLRQSHRRDPQADRTSPKRSRSEHDRSLSASKQESAAGSLKGHREWMTNYPQKQFPPLNPRHNRQAACAKEDKSVALLPYLGTNRKTPDSANTLLPVRRSVQSTDIQVQRSQSGGLPADSEDARIEDRIPLDGFDD